MPAHQDDAWGANHRSRILMFAGSYECLVLPNTGAEQFRLERALDEAREFLRICEGGKLQPAPPDDDRCSGCPWGKPREYVAGRSDTILNGNPLEALVTQANNKREYHCTCGDRFDGWVPPHEDSIRLGIAKRRMGL